MEWIRADSCLPQEDGMYLVYTDKIEILYFDGNKGAVTHWMPLPLPPKE
jgi:hypothetical protein